MNYAGSKRKIKILHVTVGLEVGGAELLLSELIPQMNREKFDVTVALLKLWGSVADDLVLNGIRVIPLKGRGKWSVGALVRLYRLVRKERYDVVQGHLYLANLACAFIDLFYSTFSFRRAKPSLLMTVHELGKWQKWYHRLLGVLASIRAERIICCSKAVAKIQEDAMGRRGASRIRIIYNGIDLNQWTRNADFSSAKEIPYKIGTIGRMDLAVKGFQYLLGAIRKVNEHFRCHLLIAGEGKDRLQFEKLVRDLDMTGCVTLVSSKSSRTILDSIDLFVLPSIEEGFGMVLLEAMASKKPVVASDVGGVPEIVVDGETGILVAPKDEEALAKAIRYVKEHPEKASEMGEKGFMRVKQDFQLSRTVEATEQLYLELMQQSL